MLTKFVLICNLILQTPSILIFSGKENIVIEKMPLEVLTLVNDIRNKGCNCGDTYYPPAKKLKYNFDLERAANNLANDMFTFNYFNHVDTQGNTVVKRLEHVGYPWMACAENIAKNQPTAELVVEGWLKSPKHCKNIMNNDFDEMGVAKVGPYWTQVLGIK